MQFKSDADRARFWNDQKIAAERFETALSKLEPKISRVLKMFFQSGHTLKEIEVILQVSGRNVRHTITDGMEKLYKLMNES